MHKTLKAIAVAAAMSLAIVAAPNQAAAQHHHGGHGHGGHGAGIAAGIIGGLAAGAIIGGIAANQGYYGPGYGYGPGYYYGPGPYAYEAPVYVRPAPRYYRGGQCWIETDSSRGYGYYGPC
jgi:hypothetical protein